MWKYFSYESDTSLSCPCCNSCLMHNSFMDHMDILRCAVGFPLVVSSGYRCPSYNASISKTGTRGPHTTGRAIDLLVTSEQALIVVGEAYNLGFTGIGVSQKGDHKKRFIHLDDLSAPEFPRPTIFSY